MDNKHDGAEILKVEHNPRAASKFVLVEVIHGLGRIAIISLGNNLVLRILSGSNLHVWDTPPDSFQKWWKPISPAPRAPPLLLSFSLGSWGNARKIPNFLFVAHFQNSETQEQFWCMLKKKKVKTGLLGPWNYSACYHNDGSMLLYVCPNP